MKNNSQFKSELYFFLIFSLFSITSCTEQREKIEDRELKSFRKFLVDNNLDKNLNVQNEFETLNKDNFYSNHYFKFSTKFPKNYILDRGNEEFTILRGMDSLTSSTVYIGVTPISNSKSSHEDFQNSPSEYVDKIFGGDFKQSILNTFSNRTTVKVLDLDVSEHKVRSTNYVVSTVKFEETYDSIQVPFVTVQYVTYLWGNLFLISFTSPEVLFDPKILSDIVLHTNYLNPNHE
jgi:hypothetical protein